MLLTSLFVIVSSLLVNIRLSKLISVAWQASLKRGASAMPAASNQAATAATGQVSEVSGPRVTRSLLIASLLAVALAACGKKEEPAPAPAPAAEAPAAPAPAAPAADAAAPAAPAADAAAPAAPAADAAAPAAPAADAAAKPEEKK